MIRLDVSRIKNVPGETLRLDLNFPMDPVQSQHGQVSFNSPLRLTGFLTNEGGKLKLTGCLEGEARIACGRCLDLFDLPLKAEMDEVYCSECREGQGPGGEWVLFRGDVLDVTAEVAKAVLSALPMKLLCREDCRGLCQRCGTNLNREACRCSTDDVDPRMEVLRKLLKDGN
ncbi:MAG: DUF177 domain-containing protein [Peptococcaceae bacterium]|nr:DUF177 domain-containing protein [Peptococcaceae bacterium]